MLHSLVIVRLLFVYLLYCVEKNNCFYSIVLFWRAVNQILLFTVMMVALLKLACAFVGSFKGSFVAIGPIRWRPFRCHSRGLLDCQWTRIANSIWISTTSFRSGIAIEAMPISLPLSATTRNCHCTRTTDLCPWRPRRIDTSYDCVRDLGLCRVQMNRGDFSSVPESRLLSLIIYHDIWNS
jgi:hypothetical protein